MKNALRWIVCVPAGVIGGFLVLMVFSFLGNRYAEPGSIGSLINFFIGGALSGAAVVYIVAYIAPSLKKGVSVTVALLAIVGMVVALPTMIEDKDWHYLLFSIAQDGGSIFMAYKIFRNEITF